MEGVLALFCGHHEKPDKVTQSHIKATCAAGMTSALAAKYPRTHAGGPIEIDTLTDAANTEKRILYELCPAINYLFGVCRLGHHLGGTLRQGRAPRLDRYRRRRVGALLPRTAMVGRL